MYSFCVGGGQHVHLVCVLQKENRQKREASHKKKRA